mgnify:CR=1 FL=1
MTVRQFIKTYRKEIDAIVKEYYGVIVTNDKDRHRWLLDDEGLYRMAHREGVNI